MAGAHRAAIAKVDSAIGPFHRDSYDNEIKSIVAETMLAEGLALQLRYGQDDRINDPLRASATTVYAPGATGNNYIDPATGRAGTAWAIFHILIITLQAFVFMMLTLVYVGQAHDSH